MSPILVRPVREQLEHDRVIRLLQAKYKRKFEVAINPGHEQSAPVGGPPPWYPDLVLQAQDKSRKLLGVVEVETTESVNHLEAMSQWAAFSRLKVPFHLYVPTGCVDSARRLCADLQIPAAEVWAYHALGDQMRFALVHKSDPAPESKRPAAETKSAAVEARRADGDAKRPIAAAKRPAAAAKRPAGDGKRPAATPAKAATSAATASGRGEGAATRSARRTAPAVPAARRKTAPAKDKAASPRRPAVKSARKAAARPPRAQKRR